MRRLLFETIVPTKVEQVWSLFEAVNDYPKYIQYCHRAELVGGFEVGSVWYDWSSVVYLPMKITHRIKHLEREKLIIYSIPLFGGGEIEQKFTFEDQESKTKVVVEILIDFENKLIDSLLGGLVESRNRRMIDQTINNIQEKFHATN